MLHYNYKMKKNKITHNQTLLWFIEGFSNLNFFRTKAYELVVIKSLLPSLMLCMEYYVSIIGVVTGYDVIYGPLNKL